MSAFVSKIVSAGSHLASQVATALSEWAARALETWTHAISQVLG